MPGNSTHRSCILPLHVPKSPPLTAMGKEDYASTGGSLKFKGAKDGGIKKKKKKKKSRTKAESTDHDSERAPAAEDGNKGDQDKEQSRSESREREEGGGPEGEDYYAGKTEAERRFEERKQKRMDERLKREGIKSHKQRVEELNKYLSNLSEHHDMPRIGPG